MLASHFHQLNLACGCFDKVKEVRDTLDRRDRQFAIVTTMMKIHDWFQL